MKVYEVVLRLENGGLLFLPFPAKDDDRAKELSGKAEECFCGKTLSLKCVGEYEIIIKNNK